MERLGKGLLAGFAATLVLSALMVMKTLMGLMPQLDVIGMLSEMLGVTRFGGWVAHFLVGTILYGGTIAVLGRSLPGGSVAAGLLLGAGGWLMMMIVMMPMAGQGWFGMKLGVMAPLMTLMLHLIFGAVLGWVYGKLHASPIAGHDDRHVARHGGLGPS